MLNSKFYFSCITCLLMLFSCNDLSAQLDPQVIGQNGGDGKDGGSIFDTDVAGGIPRKGDDIDCYAIDEEYYSAEDDRYFRLIYQVNVGEDFDRDDFPCNVELQISTPNEVFITDNLTKGEIYPDQDSVKNELDRIECIDGVKEYKVTYEFICMENGIPRVLTALEVYQFLGISFPTNSVVADPNSIFQLNQTINICCGDNFQTEENNTDFRSSNNLDLHSFNIDTEIAVASVLDEYQISFNKADFQRSIKVDVYDFSGRILSTTKASIDSGQESFSVKKPNNLHNLYLLSINIDGQATTKKVLNY